MLSLSLLIGFIPLSTKAQFLKFLKLPKADTNYVGIFDHYLTTRLFFSKKYTNIGIGGNSTNAVYSGLQYKPNTNFNFGLGATYGPVTLNLGFGFTLEDLGKTNYLDLQSHFYAPQFVIDLFGQFYKGYYLSPKNYITSVPGYYHKPDLGLYLFGLSFNYIFNPKRFSYKAALAQNQWQKQSAGTFLAGFQFYYGILNSESSLIPRPLAGYFPQSGVNRLRFVNFGPGIGYAYSFVYKRHWFATVSLTGNLLMAFTKETDATQFRTHISFRPGLLYRLGIGYNSRKWELVLSLVNNSIKVKGAYEAQPYTFQMGNYRMTFAWRFPIKRKIRKIIPIQ